MSKPHICLYETSSPRLSLIKTTPQARVVSAKISSTVYDPFPFGFKLSGYKEQTLPLDPNFDGNKGNYTIPVSGNYSISVLSIYSIKAKRPAEIVETSILLDGKVIATSAWNSPPGSSDTTFSESKFVTITDYFKEGGVISTLLVNPTVDLITASFFFTVIPRR